MKKISLSDTRYDGFAFILDGIDPDAAVNRLNLDINVWIDGDRKGDIDFGLKIPVGAREAKLVMYAPYLLRDQDIHDLWSQIGSREIIHGIFDSNLATDSSEDDEVIRVKYKGPSGHAEGQDNLSLIPFESDLHEGSTVGIRPTKGHFGSVITFNLKRITGGLTLDGSIYLRFRIPFSTLNDQFPTMRSYRGVFTSPSADCRLNMFIKVNEERHLPPSIRAGLHRQRTRIGKTYIILVADERWNVNSVRQPYRIRNLEEGLWEQYWPALKRRAQLPLGGPKYMVYQWELSEDGGGIKGFSLLVSLNKTKVNAPSLLFYLFIFIAFDFFSELVIRLVFGS